MRITFAICIAIALSACATGYQSQGLTGGFTETQLDRNVFRVTFKGNGYTQSERAEDFALMRSAEIALRHGFSHFAIVDGRQGADYGVVAMPTYSYTTGSVVASGNAAYGSARTTTTGGQPIIFKKPSSTNTIVCFNGKPENGQFVYDAKYVYNSIAAKYDIKPGQ